MNNCDKTNKGESIIPSARRSIHSHSSCPFDEKYIMGKHGLIKNKYNFANSSLPINQHDEDVDEVDNIMSKFAHPIQIPPRKQKKIQRRNSLDLNTQDFTSDDSDILSKSLPSSLQTKPCCSDDSHSDQDNTQVTDTSNESPYIRSNISWNENSTQREASFTKSQHFKKQNNILERNSGYQWLVIPVVLTLLAVAYGTGVIDNFQNKLKYDSTVRSTNEKYDKTKFYNDLSNIGKKYKVNDDTILQLQIGISLISEKHDSASFMFVYNSEASNFATESFNDFVNEVVFITARYLRNENPKVHHVVVDSSRLFLRDSNELIEKYKEDVRENGVLLLMEIDKLPSSLAKDLHYYSDEYNPLVKKSAIFSTLDLANCSDQKSTHKHIEKCLLKKWHSLPVDTVGPLLTRVVGIVVDLTNVFLYK